MLRCVARRFMSPSIRGATSMLGVTSRKMSSKPKESDEAFDNRWHAYFSRPDLDAWELRKGLNEIYGHDLVPEPRIIIAMLHACRRLNDFPMTVRILEAVNDKGAGNSEIYNYILSEIKPTMEELGLSTPEELGLVK
ncbi:cytochrome c oxidase subunit 5A, mitochondrial-like [Stylophora pistillata]|uniref:Cytochrome c oxidase subunit 5A, mitochondrial n=1 Tax=Stylophora pistillata TaxID=50429 RepID=A0A2B4RZU5_STYPI|nr:cytochrome c oxidase subunit 5A, mitochondrial-like [Stylophora pistillata]PFX22676.1 Cytochrome c oxidase subunit 5A, mitochondrial [Stylophora pistillata]